MVYTHGKDTLRIDLYDRGGNWSLNNREGGDIKIVFKGEHGLEVVLQRQWYRPCGNTLMSKETPALIVGCKVIVGEDEFTR